MTRKHVAGSPELHHPQLARLHTILRRIQEGNYPNRTTLARELEVDIRTVQRDLSFLQDTWQVPLAYDPQRFGFYFTEPVSEFPMVPISHAELVSVFVAQQSLAPFVGTSLEAPLRSAFQKLVSSLDGELSVEWQSLQQAISIRGGEARFADAALFQELSSAARKRLEVEFEYRKLRAGGRERGAGSRAEGFEPRRVRPYHLACIGSVWYLFGFDLGRKGTRTFALSRMRRLKVTEAGFERPKGFSVEKMLRGSFGVFEGKELKKMRIRFDGWAAQLIRERVWHRSQKITELRGGAIELELELSSTVEVVQWILSWGEHARALEPRELVKEVAEQVERTRALYGAQRLRAPARTTQRSEDFQMS